MTASLVVSGFVFLLVGLQSRPWAIAIGMFALAVVADAFRPAVMSAVAARSPDLDRARSLALLRLAANLGLAIGPAIGGVLALVDYLWLFVVDAATCWAAAVVLVRRLRRTELVSVPKPPNAEMRRRGPWRDGPFLALMVVMVLLAIALFQVFSTLPVYYRDAYGLREDAIGMLLAMNAALIAMFEMVLIHRLQDLDRLRVAALGALLMCGGFGLMPLVSTIPLVAATVVVWTIGEMLVLPMINVIVADRGSAGGRGRYMGLYTMAFSVAFLAGPTAGTWVYQHLGADTLWTIVGALGPVIAVALLALRRPLRPVPAELVPPVHQAQM
jgi:MFS family permease